MALNGYKFVDPQTVKTCPKCNGSMEIRRSFKNSSYFLGCADYPRCRYTENVDCVDLVNFLLLTSKYLDKLIEALDDAAYLNENFPEEIAVIIDQIKTHVGDQREALDAWHADRNKDRR